MYKCCHAAWIVVWRGTADLSRTSGSCLAGMGRGDRREGGETGDACLCPWALVEPRDNAVDIDGRSDRDVLQMRFCHTPIPGPSQAKGADALGQGAFDPGAALIAFLA